jgi:hypothetical protein
VVGISLSLHSGQFLHVLSKLGFQDGYWLIHALNEVFNELIECFSEFSPRLILIQFPFLTISFFNLFNQLYSTDLISLYYFIYAFRCVVDEQMIPPATHIYKLDDCWYALNVVTVRRGVAPLIGG